MTTVLFAGDSITVGLVGVAQGKTDGSSFRGPASRALGWTGVGPFKDPNGLLHGGVGGSTTYTFLQGKAQFVTTSPDISPVDAKSSWVLTYKPDLVHLMLGVNDIISFPKESPLDLFNRLHDLAAGAVWQMKDYLPFSRVLVSTVCESLFPEQVIRAHALNAKILSLREVGSDYSIIGVDSAGPFNAAIAASGVSPYTVDGTHPNQRGYDLIAQGLVSSVSSSQGSSGLSTGQKVIAGAAVLAGAMALKKWIFS